MPANPRRTGATTEHSTCRSPFAAIGEINDEIDLKDDKYGGEEVAGIRHPFAGIVSSRNDDNPRLERGAAMPGEHYRYCSSRQGGK